MITTEQAEAIVRLHWPIAEKISIDEIVEDDDGLIDIKARVMLPMSDQVTITFSLGDE